MKKIIMTFLLFFMPFSALAYSEEVFLGGENIGIKVNTKGILVVGFYRVDNKYINKDNINVGDYIIKIENEPVNDLDEFSSLVNKYIKDDKVNITIMRANKELETSLELRETTGVYKTGLYVKDSLTGIGTITYIDPNTHVFGALGHEITESNTLKKIEIESGNIYDSEVTSINKSSNGNPGSKNAEIDFDENLGNIKTNTTSGIFGNYTNPLLKDKYKVATFDEIKLGTAYIYTVTEGKNVKKYKINITKLNENKIDTAKSIAFVVDDQNLIKESGGIVQGMSGSPIVQDNKIIGAVTNVVVDKVNTGYAIFIRTMLKTGDETLAD